MEHPQSRNDRIGPQRHGCGVLAVLGGDVLDLAGSYTGYDGITDSVDWTLLAFRASCHLFNSRRATLAGGAFSLVKVRAIGPIFVSAMDATQLPNVLIVVSTG